MSGEDPYSGIFDFSKVVEDVVSSEGISDLARKAAIILSGKLRVVVASTPSLHGLFRMYEMSRDGMSVDLQVVGSIDEAYRMFGVHPEDFSQRLFPADISRPESGSNQRIIHQTSPNEHPSPHRGEPHLTGQDLRRLFRCPTRALIRGSWLQAEVNVRVPG